AAVLLYEQRVDALGVLVALGGEVGRAQVRPRLDAVRVQLDRPLERGDGGAVVAELVGGQTGPHVGGRVGRARLDDRAELFGGGTEVAEAVVGAAGDEAGRGRLRGVGEPGGGALGVAERLLRLGELVVSGGEGQRYLGAF